MPRIIHIATTTLSSEKDGYRLLEAGEVERFLRDHPDDKDILPALIEASKASLKSEASLKDERAPTLEDR